MDQQGPDLGRLLIFLGLAIVAVGVLVWLGGRLGLGRLPGDVSFRRGDTSFHFPIVTSIVISIVLTLLLNVFLRR
ncbi:MAG TPA: DUF2905 domain-containing protein [Vicinamibacteria bacterium]|nr:DUF2905 domain-containing protein [Vicinamibacteria bacterium]